MLSVYKKKIIQVICINFNKILTKSIQILFRSSIEISLIFKEETKRSQVSNSRQLRAIKSKIVNKKFHLIRQTRSYKSSKCMNLLRKSLISTLKLTLSYLK